MQRAILLLVLGVAACDSDFVPPSELRSVRVMAVQKHAAGADSDAPWSTAEGAALEMTMLAFDGREDRDAEVRTLWFSGCSNPSGEAYYGCFTQLAVMGLLLDQCRDTLGPLPRTLDLEADPELLQRVAECAPELAAVAASGGASSETGAGGAANFGSLRIGAGAAFTFDVPEGVVLDRDGTSDYGVSYVFFAACAGRIGLVEEYRQAFQTGVFPSDGLLFPLGCYDDAGELRSVEHFVAGYTTVYSYGDESESENTNPPIDGAVVRGEKLAPSAGCETDSCPSVPKICVGLDCVPEASCDGEQDCPIEAALPSIDAGQEPSCSDYAACVPVCTKGHAADCPKYAFEPLLDPDEVLAGPGARDEQLWIRYYASAGSMSRDPVRLYDSNTGWNDDYGTEFRAPREPGPFYLWAAVHDNRGGVNWTRVAILAQ